MLHPLRWGVREGGRVCQGCAKQTRIGIFWNYDSVAWIGTPVNVYNQLALQVALARTLDPLELARALALVNVALADAAIAVWDAKYAYDFWRALVPPAN